jgi:hypothetical protein
MGSKPTQGMDVYNMCVYSVCAVLCVLYKVLPGV